MSSIKDAFNKASSNYNDNAFLQKEIAIRLDSKLNVICANSDVIIDLGSGSGFLSDKLSKRYLNSQLICIDFAQQLLKNNKQSNKICADTYKLPLTSNSIDIIASNLMMQWCYNLDIVFSECFRVLKNGGLIIFSTFGPDTLKELKKSWAVVDDKTHVNNFIDMHDIGDKILASGFQNPVMEMEKLVIIYKTVVDIMLDLKTIGAQTVKNRPKTLVGKNKFQAMIKAYESYRKNGKLPVTYEVIYGHAWKKADKSNDIHVDNE